MHNPFILVLFGATGDLTQKKLIPVLFGMFKKNILPDDFYIVGMARREFSSASFAALFTDFVIDPQWNAFTKHLIYHQGIFEDDAKYVELSELLNKIDIDSRHFSRIFYLATPPKYYETILGHLYTHKNALSQKLILHDRLAKLAIEKPFGKDVRTARELDKKLADNFSEWQVFRVDHYLGKETVQNMLVFRFANSVFEPVWNNQFIDHVQIHWSESKGIEGRGNFWEGVGLLRDFAQNHLMQLIAAVAMDMPRSFSKEGVRDARAQVISSLRCIDSKDVTDAIVRAQYRGYKDEKDVSPDSLTETFIAMKFFINNDRFLGVPFYVRAGKAMDKNAVSISVVFKQTCHILFREIGCPEQGNVLTFHIQPEEGISLQIIAKKPGTKLSLQTVDMHFSYHEHFKTKGTDAYEKILLDIFAGDQMLFNRSDELESSWQFITNILNGWEQTSAPISVYEKGSAGPEEADNLIERDGRKWL